MGCRSSSNHRLGTLADHLRSSGSCRSFRQIEDNHADGVNTLTGRQDTARRSNRRSNAICCGRFRSHINRRSMVITNTPGISDIARPTILVDVQRNVVTFANSSFRSNNLNIRTESINRERVRNSLTTIRAGNGYSINTGRNLKCIRCNFSSRIRAPCIFGSIYCISCQQCAVTFADNVVTCDGNQCRSSLNRDCLRLRNIRNTTLVAHSPHTERMVARGEKSEVKNTQVLTLNLETIQIPNIGST